MSNSALENVMSNNFVNEAQIRSNRIPSSGLFECPDAELGARCREVCLDEFIACITDCGSEVEGGFHIEFWANKRPSVRSSMVQTRFGLQSAIDWTPELWTPERHRLNVNLKTLLSVRVTVREKILIVNMHVHVAVDVQTDVQ